MKKKNIWTGRGRRYVYIDVTTTQCGIYINSFLVLSNATSCSANPRGIIMFHCTMQNVVNCLYEDTYRMSNVTMIACLHWGKLEFRSCASDFLPRCIWCCNEDVDHHSVTHVKAMFHCPSKRKNKFIKEDIEKIFVIFVSSHFPDIFWNYFRGNTIISLTS